MSNGGDRRLTLWAIILMSGCGLMFVAFFMPWWGITVTFPAPPSRPNAQDQMEAYRKEVTDFQETMDKIGKHIDKYDKKHKSILGEDRLKEMSKELREKGREQVQAGNKGESTTSVSVTARAWGFNFVGIALTCFIFSIVLLPIAIVPMFVKMLRNWIWIGYFVAAISGLVLFILTLVWYFSSPGANLGKHVAQGVGLSPGPYMDIVGSLATLIAGVLGGVFGLLAFLKSVKSGEPKAKPAKKKEMDFVDDDEF